MFSKKGFQIEFPLNNSLIVAFLMLVVLRCCANESGAKGKILKLKEQDLKVDSPLAKGFQHKLGLVERLMTIVYSTAAMQRTFDGHQVKEILDYTNEDVVSADFVGDTVDHTGLLVMIV